MKDYTPEAEALFRDFAKRHSLSITMEKQPHVELVMRVPSQPGLSFELTLGLQNVDELNIGFAGFWSYIFPFDQKRVFVALLLDGLVAGECRLAIHKQFGRVVKRVLERRVRDVWTPVYHDIGIRFPFVRTRISYVYNDEARESAVSR